MPPQAADKDGFFKLTPEQSRRLASAPSVKVEGFPMTEENRAFFACRGIDLDDLRIGEPQEDPTNTRRPENFRRPHYTPLASQGQMRILVLEPGSEEDPLRCRLHHHTLQKRQSYDPELESYDALSYTWNAPIRTRHYTSGPSNPGQEFTPASWIVSAMSGSAYTVNDGTPPASFASQADQMDENELMRPVEVLIDGTVCDVTGNLAAALEHLRHPDRARHLWVDAICIDQGNLQERGQQVSQMDRVYQGADTVHVWLGPTADGSDRAMILAENMWKYGVQLELDCIELFKSEKIQDQLTMLSSIEDLTVLLMRPWFTRRWVVQELALARKAVVHCGTQAVSWEALAFAVSFLRTRRLELTYMRIRQLYMRADPKTYRRGYLKTLAAETLADMSKAAVRRLPSPGTHPAFEWRADLEYLLSSLSSLQCTNPLDTVYALLAIASDNSALGMGPPDYSTAVETLYQNAVLRIIETKHSLNILCQQWAARVDSSIRLPSWIQCFSPAATRHEGGADNTQERRRFVGDGRACKFRAAGLWKKQGIPGKLTDREASGRTLMVTGIIVDVIEYVGEGAFQDIPGSWKDLAEGGFISISSADVAKVRRSQDDLLTLPAIKQNHPHTTAEWYAAFADLVTAGSSGANSYTNPTYGPICQALFVTDSPYRRNNGAINIFEVRADPTPAKLYRPGSPNTQLPPASVHAFLDEMAACTHHRSVALTVTGTLALVDALIPRAEAGDAIAVLSGCDVPVVLRPKEVSNDGTTTGHGVFEFVGEAYVQGSMHGEAIELAGKRAERYVGGIFLV